MRDEWSKGVEPSQSGAVDSRSEQSAGGSDQNAGGSEQSAGGSEAEEASGQTETGLIIPVPEFEDFVCSWRQEVDAVPPVGVPAHISLLYPFLTPERVATHRDDIGEFFEKIDSFEFTLTRVGWFERRVVFLCPDPADAFLDITGQLMARWTQCLPYGGRHKEIVPHLTLGIEGSDKEMDRLADAANDLLPVHCRAEEVWLMQGTSRPPRWRVEDKYSLNVDH